MVHFLRNRLFLLSVTVMILCSMGEGTAARAQMAATGTITGSVTDSTGAAIPGAEINILAVQTGVQTHAKSSSAGEFSSPGLPVGNYDVTVNAAGMATYRAKGIYLEPAATYTVSARMTPAGTSAEVTVEATQVQVQTQTPEISNEVYKEQIVEIPLNGRSYEGLASLMPGVTNINAGTALGSGGYTTQNSMNINGTGQTGTLYTVDGIWNMNTSNMQETTIKPNPDQIQEIKVLQNNYSAVNNIMGANAVIVLTKSGTAQLHGGGWEFYRNTAFDAKNYFSPTSKPAEDQNLYGFDLGGPVVIPGIYHGRERTFFYTNLQWVQQAQAMVFNGTTPTAAMRGIGTPNGDALFPSTGLYSTAALKDPTKTGTCSATVKTACFAQDANGNWIIPAARLDKPALALLNALAPLPNNQTAATTNFLLTDPAQNHQLDQEYKIEHNITSKYRLLAEFLHEGQSYAYPRGQRIGSAYPTNHDVFDTHNSLAQVALTQNLTTSMTNTTSMAMNRYIFYHDIVGIAHVSDVPGYTQNLAYTGGYLQNYLPAISFSGGWSIMGTGSQYILPRFAELELILTDNWAWQHGHHFLQAGGNMLWGTHASIAPADPRLRVRSASPARPPATRSPTTTSATPPRTRRAARRFARTSTIRSIPSTARTSGGPAENSRSLPDCASSTCRSRTSSRAMKSASTHRSTARPRRRS